ncbi:hypothetical protein KFK09_011985 [Dendrobium nobile]|uniref:Uncharacterized protein n=1 Tax=Dendrobium nobile TaxID=94219 RepID=A0A8T3BHJ4_DENNO|nr:hypothetical protein KFK09_011985 [Dendrobium nobile]
MASIMIVANFRDVLLEEKCAAQFYSNNVIHGILTSTNYVMWQELIKIARREDKKPCWFIFCRITHPIKAL